MKLFHLSLFFGLFSQLWCVSSDADGSQSSISYEYQTSSHHANSDDCAETKSRNSNERWSQSQQDDELVQENGFTDGQQPRPSRQVSNRDIQPVASSELRFQTTVSENSQINLAEVPKIKSAPTVKENYLKKYIEENNIIETDGISSEEESYEYNSNAYSSGYFFFEEEQTSLGPEPSSIENIRLNVNDFSTESTKSTSINKKISNSNDALISTTKEIDSNKLEKSSLNKIIKQVYDTESSFERKEIPIQEEATQDLTIVGKTHSEPETDFKPIINSDTESIPIFQENSQLQTDSRDVKELPVTENQDTTTKDENLSQTHETVFKNKNVDETLTDEQLSVTQQILPTVLQESMRSIKQSESSYTNDIVPEDDFENLIPQQQQQKQSVGSEIESKSVSLAVNPELIDENETSHYSNQNKNHIVPEDISLAESLFNKASPVPVTDTITEKDIEADSLIVQKDVATLKSYLLSNQVKVHGEPGQTVDKDGQAKRRAVSKEVAESTSSSVSKIQNIVPESDKNIDEANKVGSRIMSKDIAESASSVVNKIQITVPESEKIIDEVNHPKRRIISEKNSASSSSFSSRSEIASAQDASGKTVDAVKPSKKSIVSNDAIAASSSSIVSSSQIIETGQKNSSPEIITSKDSSSSSSSFASNSQIIISEQDAGGKKEPTKNIITSKDDVAMYASSSVSKTESVIPSEQGRKTKNIHQTGSDEHIISKDTSVSSSSLISSSSQSIVPEHLANVAIDEPVKPSKISITSRNTAESAGSISFESIIPDHAKIKIDKKQLVPSDTHSMLKETSASSLSESILESKSNLQGHIEIASADKNNKHSTGSNAHTHTSHNTDTENSKNVLEPGYDTILEYLYAHSNSSFIRALKNSNPKRIHKTG